MSSCKSCEVVAPHGEIVNKLYHMLITLPICTRLLSQVTYMKNRLIGSTSRIDHGKSTSCEHGLRADEF